MDEREFYISKTPDEAIKILQHYIIKESSTAQVVGQTKRSIGAYTVIVFVMDKFFFWPGTRASLTVTLDNFDEHTKVHVVVSGSSGSPLIQFSRTVVNKFMKSVEDALQPWIVQPNE